MRSNTNAEVKAADIEHFDSEPKFKPLWLFVVAANSLLLAGSFANLNSDWIQILVMQWCGLCGVFIIYRFNDLIDQSHDLRFNLRRLLSNKLHLFFLLQFLLITIPAVFIFLSWFRIALLSGICIFGIIYSVNFGKGKTSRRIKNIFIVKNSYIGLLWGILILIGAGAEQKLYIPGLIIFAVIQVSIGSIIRDIPDLDRDRLASVKSFPVVFGIKKTILILHLFNLGTLAIGFSPKHNGVLLPLILITCTWRTINLLFISPSGISSWWTQTFNLLTCTLILLSVVILRLYALH